MLAQKSVNISLPALLNWSACVRKSQFFWIGSDNSAPELSGSKKNRNSFEYMQWTNYYNYFEAPLQVIFAREGGVINNEESLIGTHKLLLFISAIYV